jgi:hypothetical protein
MSLDAFFVFCDIRSQHNLSIQLLHMSNNFDYSKMNWALKLKIHVYTFQMILFKQGLPLQFQWKKGLHRRFRKMRIGVVKIGTLN